MSLFTVSSTKVFDKLLGNIYKIKKRFFFYLEFLLLEKATSPLLLEPDWESILQLCDILKSQEVP